MSASVRSLGLRPSVYVDAGSLWGITKPTLTDIVAFCSPATGTTAGKRVEVQVAITGLKLDGTKIGLPAAQNPGVGHWHIYVDGKYAGLSVSDVISLPNDAMPVIAPGPHEIKVELHNTDHTPLQPEVTDTEMLTFQ